MWLGCEQQDMAAEERDTSRAPVKTYVPAYQRDEWDDHADELDMSRSEFVRTMVQAGRRGFTPGGNGSETPSQGAPDIDNDSKSRNSVSDPTAEPTPTADVEDIVLGSIADECLSWDELRAELTADIERQLEETIDRLQEEGLIKHSPRQGGYVLVE